MLNGLIFNLQTQTSRRLQHYPVFPLHVLVNPCKLFHTSWDSQYLSYPPHSQVLTLFLISLKKAIRWGFPYSHQHTDHPVDICDHKHCAFSPLYNVCIIPVPVWSQLHSFSPAQVECSCYNTPLSNFPSMGPFLSTYNHVVLYAILQKKKKMSPLIAQSPQLTAPFLFFQQLHLKSTAILAVSTASLPLCFSHSFFKLILREA